MVEQDNQSGCKKSSVTSEAMGLLGGLGAGAVVHRHVEAVLGQAQAQRRADAAGAARDQGGPAPGPLGLVLLAHLIPLGCS